MRDAMRPRKRIETALRSRTSSAPFFNFSDSSRTSVLVLSVQLIIPIFSSGHRCVGVATWCVPTPKRSHESENHNLGRSRSCRSLARRARCPISFALFFSSGSEHHVTCSARATRPERNSRCSRSNLRAGGADDSGKLARAP